MESYDLTTGTFSGTSKRLFYFSIAAFIAGAAMLVAGSVMLGVGIHKYNQNVDNAAAVPPSSTTMTTGTNPDNSHTGSSTITSGTGTPAITTSGTGAPTTMITTSGTGAIVTTTGPFVGPTTSEVPPTGPPGAPDILIMIDTSENIGPENFALVKDYIATNISQMLPLGASSFFDRAGEKTNVAIVGFSDASVNIMSYYEISDLASVRDAIADIKMSDAKTNPTKALTVVNKLGSTKSDNTNVMMVLASGTQEDLDAASTIFSEFQSNVQNFTFVALGAAGALDFSVFNNNDNVQTFNSTGYTLSEEDTNSLINSLNPTGVTAVPPTIPPPPPGPTCNKDIVILIDQSVAVGVVEDFNRQIDYLAKSLVSTWNISSSSIETFGMLYSQLGTHLLATKPFNYNTTQQFIDDLNAVKGKDPVGFSDIYGGLSGLQPYLTNRRPNFDLTVILFTYSSQFDYVAAVAEARKINGSIIVVAVNTDNPNNLYYLSGTVIETKEFFYDNITSQINTALCAAPVPPSPLPTSPPTSSVSPTPTAPSPTCANDVAILIDQSVAVGNVTDFNRQIDFLTNTLVNTWTISLNNIEALGILYSQLNAHSLSPSPFKYNTTQQFIDDISSVRDSDPKGYNDITAGLAVLQSHLGNLRPGRNLAVVLITYNDDLFDILSAIPEAQNIPGNIIIVAVNTVVENLYYLSGTVIQTDKYFNWNIAAQINSAICSPAIPPSPLPTSLPTQPPTTPTVTSPSTPSPTDYIPCRSNIVFAMDASNSMGDQEFKNMQNFITDNIVATNWTHFERVGLMSYADASSCTFEYGRFGSKEDFDNTVKNNITRSANGNSITFGMGTLMSTFNDVPLDIQNSIFFTSTSDPNDVAKAATNSHLIDMKGALIIVAISPAKKADLLPLVAGDGDKIIEIDPTSGISYETYAAEILKQFYCGGPTPTPSSTTAITTSVSVTGPTRHGVSIYTLQTVTPGNNTSTTSSQSPSPTTTGPTTTTVTQSPSPTTTGPTQSTPSIPYVPCQSWIYFGVDDSNVLSDQDFTTQIFFIANAIGNITHPERIAAAGEYSQPVPWNSGLMIPQIQDAIRGMSKAGPYLLRNHFTFLLTILKDTQINDIPVGVLIFISDTSDTALAGADQYFNQIQNVKFTFVLLGQNVDQSKLTKYSNNFISWPDLFQPEPNDWDNSYGPAYACSNITTLPPTSPTPPMTTSTTPSTSVSPSQTSSSSTASPPVTTPSPSPSSTTVTSPGSTSTVTGTTPSVPFVPCQSWIHFGVDDSNGLQPNDFTIQKNFISSAIGNITHPERIEAFSMFNDGVSWNSGLSIDQLQAAVQGMTQAGSYLLRNQFAALLNNLNNTQLNNIPVGALIFISDTSDQTFVGAADIFTKIKQFQNVQITFVLLGPNPDQNKLTQFSSSFINWKDLSQSQPDNWNNLYGTAYGCTGEISTLGPTTTTVTPSSSVTSPSTVVSTSTTASSPSSSTQTSPTPSISVTSPTSTTSVQTSTPGSTPSIPYVPCQSWIAFVVDDSNTLNRNLFPNQLDFISIAIGNITHPERIAALAMYNDEVQWNSGLPISQIQNTVTNMEQNGDYRLRTQFAAIATALSGIPSTDTQPIGALVFIPDTSVAALAGAEYYMDKMPNVNITFVLLGNNVDSSKLSNFSSNFIYWPDLNQPQPNNWDASYANAYGCSNNITTLPTSTVVTTSASSMSPTSTTSTQTVPSSSSTTSVPSTQSTGPTSTPAPGDYYPCQNWITVLVDNSNKLQPSQFLAELNFTKTIFGQMTHPERIRYGRYDAQSGSIIYDFNSNNNQQGLQAAIDNTTQTNFETTILKAIQALVKDENQNRTSPDSTLIFVTDTTNSIQIQQAVTLYNNDLKSIGVKLTFILAGQNTNANALQGFDDAIIYNWQNIGFFSKPDGWDLSAAFRCTAVSSTTGGSTSVTQTSPTTVTSTSTSTTQSSTVSSSTMTSTLSSIPSTLSTQTTSTSPSSYIPCQSWISFGVDDSNSLGIDNYNKQLNFISSAIGNLNHPERIQAIGAFDTPVFWNSPYSIAEIQNAVLNLPQEGAYRLREQLGALLISLQTTPLNNIPVGALIFISDTSDQALVGAADIFNQNNEFRSIRITFVLLGPNADQTKLTNFSSNFISWTDLSKPQPDNWDQLYPAAYGCNDDISTTIPVSSTTTTSPSSTVSMSSSVTSTTQTIPSTSTMSTSPTTTGVTPSAGPYVPCQVLVTTLVDISSTLNIDYFQKQLTFTKTFLSQINHPERIRYGAYLQTNGNMTYLWNDTNTQEGLQKAIDDTKQTSQPSSLSGAMRVLISNPDTNRTVPDSTIIFVTDTTNSIQIQQAVNLYNSALKGRVQITFILAGNKTDATALQGFDDAIFFYWQNMNTSQPDNWDTSQALRCTPLSSTTVGSTVVSSTTSSATSPTSTISSSISPTTSTTGATPSGGPYVPCQVLITTLVDISSTLNIDYFQKQLTFTKMFVSEINHPERIRYGAYLQTNGNMTYLWNDTNTQEGLQQAIDDTKQTSQPSSLSGAMRVLMSNPDTNRTVPDSTIIFVTDTTNSIQIQQAVNLYNSALKGRVQITFILAGNKTDATALQGFDDAIFFYWQNMNTSQPDNWDTSQALRCTPLSSTTIGSTVSTISTQSPATSVSTQGSTSTVMSSTSPTTLTSVPSTSIQSSTTPSSYFPCQSWISFGVDDSSGLNSNDFATQKTFISNTIGTLNHPERIQAIGAFDQPVVWNSPFSIAQIQQYVTAMQQAGSYLLRNQFAALLNSLQNIQPTETPIGALIFISDTSDQALQGASDIFGQIQNVQITFVLLGNNVDQSKLTQFSNNFISWSDLSKPQPDNWDNQASPAYGCTNGTTTPSSTSSTRGGITVHTEQTVPPGSSPSTTVTQTVPSSSLSPSTQPTGPTSTTSPGSYIPCQSWISFGVDDSNVLQNPDFMTQLNFISNAIGSLNHPERIQAIGAFDQPVVWNSPFSIDQIQAAVKGMQQAGSYSLRLQFAALLNSLQTTQINNIPIGALIFISDTSDQALDGASNIINQIQNVSITFVLLGNTPDQSKLTQFSNNFILWTDLSKPQPDNWGDDVAATAYGCTPSTASPITMSSQSSVSPTRGGITVHTEQTVTPGSTLSTAIPSSSSPSSTQSTGSTSTPAPGDYYPCQNWITVLVDNSNKLQPSQFLAQLNFTKTILGQMTHPERLRYGRYDAQNGNIIYDFNSTNNQQGLQAAIDNTTQTNFETTILKAIQALVKDENQNQTSPDSTLIFVTDTSNSIQISQAVKLYNDDLKSIGVKLTFILAGANTNANALQGFDDAIIYNWQNIGFFSQPDGWDLSTAFRCTGSPVTMSSSSSPSVTTSQTLSYSVSSSSVASTPTGTATAITTPEPYFPCQSWISFSYDDSSTLQSNDFKTQMAFISSAIGPLNYPDRLRTDGAYTTTASWKSGQTISQIQRELNNTQQTAITYSLLQEFASLVTGLSLVNGTSWPIGALIFISDTSDNALRNAIRFKPQLANVQLTFVLLGPNADSSKLTNFSSNFISWSDLSKPQPDNWDNSYFAAYGCNGIVTQTLPSTVSTASPPTTLSTIPSTSTSTLPTSTISNNATSVQTSTVTIPSTSTTTTPSTASSTPTPEPYFPCESWISFSYDDSSSLQNNDFKTQLSFISTAIGSLNYPDRLRVAGAFTNVASWLSHQNISQMQTELNQMEQTQNSYSLLQEFANLLTDFEQPIVNSTTWPIGALLFISDTSDTALAHADIYFNQLPSNMRITFVVLGGADSTKLTKYSNNTISWPDLSQPQPANWDNSYFAAYGCQ